jgi:hypothetical protein
MEVVDIVDQCLENDVSVNLWSTYRLYHYMSVLMKHLSLESFSYINVFHFCYSIQLKQVSHFWTGMV